VLQITHYKTKEKQLNSIYLKRRQIVRQKILNYIVLSLLFIISSNASAALVHPDKMVLDGDYSINVNDPLKVTALFNGTFNQINSVTIALHLTDTYSKGESYQFNFFEDSDSIIMSSSHINDSPISSSHLGLTTNGETVKSLFQDGNATFETVMLAGSVNVSFINISIDGDFVPTPVPLPMSAWLFGLAIFSLTGLQRKKTLDNNQSLSV